MRIKRWVLVSFLAFLGGCSESSNSEFTARLEATFTQYFNGQNRSRNGNTQANEIPFDLTFMGQEKHPARRQHWYD
jgi:hypothetical protein